MDLAASSVGEASSITIEVTYAGKTESSQPISNSIVTLSLDDLTLLNSSTAEAYEVTGKCDSSLSNSAGDVTVSVVETAASQTSPCSGDTFSVNFDLSAVTSDSYEEITIRAEYGGLNVQETVTNNITELAIDSDLGSLTEANKGVTLCRVSATLHWWEISPLLLGSLTPRPCQFPVLTTRHLKLKLM